MIEFLVWVIIWTIPTSIVVYELIKYAIVSHLNKNKEK